MHHHVIVKVHALDVDDARSTARDLMDSSVCIEDGTSNNELGWDYVGDITQIVKGKPGKNQFSLANFKVKTFKELERQFSPKETPVRLADVEKTLLEMFATGNYPRLPKTYKATTKFIARVIQDSMMQNNLLGHHISQLGREIDATRCFHSKERKQGYSSVHDILQCYDAYFLEIWSSSISTTERTKVFYFNTDRHI